MKENVTLHHPKMDLLTKFGIPTSKNVRNISVGRCVIPCTCFGKSVEHTFSCRKMYLVKCTTLTWDTNGKVTISQLDIINECQK